MSLLRSFSWTGIHERSSPRKMLGCRVHIVGNMNRKRAWDHDRCYVKILAARVATDDRRRRDGQDMSRPWDVATADLTTFFGHVVHAKEQRSPRQTKVVCMRSRLVRSTTSMMFRPINGKFPMISVPWSPERELPNLYDLHVIELQSWNRDKGPKQMGHPIGIYEEELNMRSRDSYESVLYSIKRSLNYCDWEDASIYSSIPVSPSIKDKTKSCERFKIVEKLAGVIWKLCSQQPNVWDFLVWCCFFCPIPSSSVRSCFRTSQSCQRLTGDRRFYMPWGWKLSHHMSEICLRLLMALRLRTCRRFRVGKMSHHSQNFSEVDKRADHGQSLFLEASNTCRICGVFSPFAWNIKLGLETWQFPWMKARYRHSEVWKGWVQGKGLPEFWTAVLPPYWKDEGTKTRQSVDLVAVSISFWSTSLFHHLFVNSQWSNISNAAIASGAYHWRHRVSFSRGRASDKQRNNFT